MTRDLLAVYPRDSARDERGRLLLGGCDALELAAEHGTPAYVVAEDDLRGQARAYRDAFEAAAPGSHVSFASKAFPCTAVLRVFEQEGLGVDVASGGELALALHAGFAPERIHLHGNARSEVELAAAVDHGLRQVVIDNFDDIERLARIAAERDAVQAVSIRVTPDVRGDTHDGISTGQADSKFGLGVADAREAIARITAQPSLRLDGLHFHIGSQLLELDVFRRAVAAIAPLADAVEEVNLGGGLGVAYVADQARHLPTVEEYAQEKVRAVRELIGDRVRIADEPGRSLVGRAGVTLYGVQTVKRNVSTWVGVDGGMADNLRPMLYGARYEVQVVDRFVDPEDPAQVAAATHCKVVGKHCESSDVLVADALLDAPRAGDVLVVPVTGAYGYAMANTYNGVPRSPVVFVGGGRSRVVVRRERVEELWARDAE
ncbi:diaminopimelate decarboxylase [Patulibacter brassicae]|jgi:diaminopimelate decarboxylase|uniref:Diaminopimelate decarboxylase n=1 Tax=Patulibacter brassicae TaxID=1705717 RepID=A0ABU4VQ85_9ACTN|nr:diaminopimelate decarboxylase [Patulibacter brassicae]MDX8153018.1 diaminopimelate decarboxylase [Patulibacter brassicae]